MREADRQLDQRVSVLDRAPTGSNAVPDKALFADIAGVDVESIRLALALEDRRVYVGRATPGESLILCLEVLGSRSSSIGPRTTLVTHGALVQGSTQGNGFVTVGIVADAVTAVRVGEADAVLGSNVFLVKTPAADQVFVRSADGERAVMTSTLLRSWRNI
jgi:hypothetical protein